MKYRSENSEFEEEAESGARAGFSCHRLEIVKIGENRVLKCLKSDENTSKRVIWV